MASVLLLVILAHNGYAIVNNNLQPKDELDSQPDEMRRSSSFNEGFWNSTLHNIAIRDAKKILDVSKYSRYADVVIKIYKKLSKKFSKRNWFVAVYDAVLGGDKHYANTCHGTWT